MSDLTWPADTDETGWNTPARRPGWSAWAARVWAQERPRRILWLPVAIGLGVVLYFELPNEPPTNIAAGIACIAAALAIWMRRWPVSVLPMALALVALGFAAAQFRAEHVAAPILTEATGPTSVEGVVTMLDPREAGLRVLLSTPRVAGLASAATPQKLRVRLTQDSDTPRLGDRVRLVADLQPPMRPVAPGAYDQRRQLWFDGIGGTGWAVRRFDRTRDLAGGETPSTVAQLRRDVVDRIGKVLEGGVGAIAIALLAGERGQMDEADVEAMRQSGLAHLLAISGMNIGIAAGFVFVVLRALLALSPFLALHWPIKKIAATAALLSAIAYTEFVGAPVSAERSMLMSGLVLSAIILDRATVSLRTVALAAIILLLAEPEELVGPSFQMSFGAVLAIVAVWESIRKRVFYWLEGGGFVRRACAYLVGVACMSALATLATAPFALYHFQQISTWGVVANVIAVPLNDFWIMGWGVLAYALLPLGLEQIALVPMGWGIALLLDIARFFAGLPGAVLHVPALPTAAFFLAVAGGLWLLLWSHRVRHFGWLAVAAAVVIGCTATPPDILVAEDGKLIGVRRDDGALALSTSKRGKFTADIWARRLGGAAQVPFPFAGVATPPLLCQRGACRAGSVLLVEAKPPANLCDGVTLVVDLVDREICPGVARIDRAKLQRDGAHTIDLRTGSVMTVAAVAGTRPWTRRD
ncbi:ComEC/Rec2 family competence protein [Roseiterribacter gracilis]|uniref:Competence protein ComEC n=1 Tax=Roseiterribacter gracilis TaxID=2812848 RepID=A0A8S8XB36_9PROT|nr:competence protein ComEC [Rhodospirillales bacterium TMPK1]